MTTKSFTIAAIQPKAIYDNLPKTIATIKNALVWAETEKVDILCLPECYLQGYILDPTIAQTVSLDLNSSEFFDILHSLNAPNITLILGLIEKDKDKIYNTAVVIEKGKLIGKYRKNHIHHKENFFTCGTDYPIFEKRDIKYGINICYDSQFPESAEALTKQGVEVIFCPLNNSLPHITADKWRDQHIKYFVEKAKTNKCWVISSDVIEKSETNTGYGCTSLVNLQGEIVEYLEQSKPGKFVKQILVK